MKAIDINKRLILFVLLVLIFLSSVRWTALKSGLYIDEGMTLYLSNGNYNGAVTTDSEYTFFDFLKKYVWKENLAGTVGNVITMVKQLGGGNYSQEGNVKWYDEARALLQGSYAWMSRDELFEQIGVTKKTGFQYGQVLVNQAMDVHPPFYYILVHTVFSLFPGTCTKWHLFSVNIIFLSGTLILLYHVIKKYFQSQSMAILSVALFGFSQGFSSCAVYFRMYAVLTFFVVAAFAVQLRLIENRFQMKGGDKQLLILTTVLGFYTHYYFILFLVGTVLLNLFYFIKEKRIYALKEYLKTIMLSGIVSVLVWPLSLYHILFGYRGTEAMAKLTGNSFLRNLKVYGEILANAYFGGSKIVFAAIIVVLGGLSVFIFMKNQKNGTGEWQKQKKNWMFLTVPSIFYSLFMVQITPAPEDRYLMCIFPFIAVLVAWGSVSLGRMIRDRWLKRGTYVIILLVFVLLNLKIRPNYLYLNQRGKDLAALDKNCIMLLLDDAYGYECVLDLMSYKQVLVLTYTDVSCLSELSVDSPGRGYIIYIHDVLGAEELLEEACMALSDSLNECGNIKKVEEVESKFDYMRAFVVEVETVG